MSNSSSTKRATRVSILIGDIPIDVYQLPDGTYRLAGRQVTDAVKEPANQLLRFYGVRGLKALPDVCTIENSEGASAVGLKPETAVDYWAYAASHKGNVTAVKLLTALSKNPSALGLPSDFKCVVAAPKAIAKEAERLKRRNQRRIANASPEKQVENRLAATLPGCQQQVLTAVGQLDILTATEVIEVKDVKAWKAALGQVLVYGGQYPSHSLRLHLFGAVRSDMRQLIEGECGRFKVKVTWE